MRKLFSALLQNSALALVAKTIYQFGNAFLFFLIARFYGSEEAGIYTLAVRYSLLFLTVAAWGLDGILIWKVAADRSLTLRYLVNFSLLRLLTGIIAYVTLALVVGNLMGYSTSAVRVILLLAWGLIPEGLGRVAQAILVAHERFVYPTIVAIVVGITRCIAGGLVVWSHSGLETLVSIQAWSSLLGLGIYVLLFCLRCSDLTMGLVFRSERSETNWRRQLDWEFMRQQLGLAFPFMLMEGFSVAEGQADIIVLSLYLPQSQVGLYGAAQSIVLPMLFALNAFHAALYPLAASLYASNRSYLWSLYRRLFLYIGLALLPVAIVLTVSARTIVNLIYGSQFISAAVVVQWLVWSVALQFLNEPNSRLIVVAGYQKTVTILLSLSLMANILLNCLLVPEFGILGSAWARLISTLLFTLSNGVTVFYRISHINPLPIVGKPILAAFVWGGILYLCQPVSIVGGLIFGGICYLLVLFLTRALTINDMHNLWRAVRRSE